MEKIIMGIQIDVRSEAAENVQKLLTEYGCHIKTRLGMHQHADVSCTEKGLLILEMVDNSNESAEELIKKLDVIEGVVVKSMRF
jgi:ribose 5-phosphate isomerase